MLWYNENYSIVTTNFGEKVGAQLTPERIWYVRKTDLFDISIKKIHELLGTTNPNDFDFTINVNLSDVQFGRTRCFAYDTVLFQSTKDSVYAKVLYSSIDKRTVGMVRKFLDVDIAINVLEDRVKLYRTHTHS